MQKTNFLQVPDRLSLLEFFESEPKELDPKDGYWCYEFTDTTSATLRVSFNTHEASIQTEILIGGQSIATVAQEGATRLQIIDSKTGQILQGEFDFKDSHTALSIQIRPLIRVQWSTLIDEK
jgi:hypothetical protein